MESKDQLAPEEILAFYEKNYNEKKRLDKGKNRIEFCRTTEIIERYLSQSPLTIYDIGGGPGAYAFWLAEKGHNVHLLDPVRRHIEEAKERSKETQIPIKSFTVGDARDLKIPDETADIVLMLGPLYHLTERSERLSALCEARRVLKTGGTLFAAVISRFASALDGMRGDLLNDSQFFKIIEQDLRDGQHRNPDNHPAYFTTAFFHHPTEIKEEVEEAGFQYKKTLAIEGPGWLLQNFDEQWADKEKRERLLSILRQLEEETTLLGSSAHIMAIAEK